MRSTIVCGLFLFCVACSPHDFVSMRDVTVGFSVEEMEGAVPMITGYISSNAVLERAYKMATIEWTPLKPAPMNGGGNYKPGVTVTGVPYSSVKEINTYLFQDVSYHTFMTAVHNPNSVFYTENISAPPYHGLNCAPYYGSVCSSSVMWALGIDIPYYARQIITLPDMIKLEHQVIDSLKICDVMWKTGHVQMVYNVEHRADTLYQVTTFESSGSSAHIKTYSKAEFQKMWDKGRYVAYRYNKIQYSQEPADVMGFEPIVYNDDLCPSKGDRSVYRATDTVTVNILNPNYKGIKLTKESSSVLYDSIGGDEYMLYNLTPGIYYVSLYKGDKQSAPVSFEIIDTSVSCYLEAEGVKVSFPLASRPEYVALCDINGGSEYYRISSTDREQGYITIPLESSSLCFCKVVFQGKYGRIINKPIQFK